MIVRDKLQSDNLIVSMGLNYVPFINVFSKEEAEYAISKIPEPIGFRAKKSWGGGLVGNMDREEAIAFLQSSQMLPYPCSVYQDIHAIDEHLIYQGEIQLHPDGTMCGVYCTVPGIKNRYACLHPEAVRFGTYFQSPQTLEEVSWDWRPVREIVDYCCQHSLIGPVIEYSYFSVPLGVKNESIVIWEIRSY